MQCHFARRPLSWNFVSWCCWPQHQQPCSLLPLRVPLISYMDVAGDGEGSICHAHSFIPSHGDQLVPNSLIYLNDAKLAPMEEVHEVCFSRPAHALLSGQRIWTCQGKALTYSWAAHDKVCSPLCSGREFNDGLWKASHRYWAKGSSARLHAFKMPIDWPRIQSCWCIIHITKLKCLQWRIY